MIFRYSYFVGYISAFFVHNLHPVSFIKLKDDLYSEMNKYLADDGEEQSED